MNIISDIWKPIILSVVIIICFAKYGQAGMTDEDQKINFGGALELNYSYKDFDEHSKARGGDLDFGSFRLKADGSINNVILSIEYRYYSFMHTIRYGWMGYNLTDDMQLQIGITRVPFGILPFASHTFWETTAFPLGFEDDFDMGIKAIWKRGDWDFRLAFFKNDEYSNPFKLDRYSIDVVIDENSIPGQFNEEQNQGNLRLARTIPHGDLGKTELGFSGQLGSLYNNRTDSHGNQWAVAVHLNGDYGPFNVMLEGIRYAFNPKNPEKIVIDAETGEYSEVDDRIVAMGAFADAYAVAAEGSIWVANVAYAIPVKIGPVKMLTCYNDFSVLIKKEKDFRNSYINTIGCLFNANPVWIYVDAIMGRNSLYLGGPRDSFAAGGDNESWHTRFNINITYYF